MKFVNVLLQVLLPGGLVLCSPHQAPCAETAYFQNLNFEQATVAPTPVGGYGTSQEEPSQAFPGWTSSGRYALYNTYTLGSVAQVLVGPNFPNGMDLMPLEGSYSVLLQYGAGPFSGPSFLQQTGFVPADARYVTFLMSSTFNDARVSLDGQVLSLVDIGNGRMAGDVSAFAGREATLEFSTTSYFGNWFYFDDVRFSQVPEPGAWALLLFSALCAPFVWRRYHNKQ